MNDALWKNIVEFDLDLPLSEYGFSIRLQNEQFWTENFTAAAITEYKKFMYLAAISQEMVSPSVIVDTVWHQHLLFSNSYEAFCRLLGKHIAHIPSTHHSSDHQKFKSAKEETLKLYQEHFGDPPPSFWKSSNMLEPLPFQRSGSWGQLIIILGLLLSGFVFYLGHTFPDQFYLSAGNPDFVIAFTGMCLLLFAGLEIYNRKQMNSAWRKIDQSSFIFQLTAAECIYLAEGNLIPVANGFLNQLVTNKAIRISAHGDLSAGSLYQPENAGEYCILQTLGEKEVPYPQLLGILVRKPVFNRTKRTMDALKTHYIHSTSFLKSFAVNYFLLMCLLSLGCVRLTHGILSGKPVGILTALLVAFLILMVYSFYRLTIMMGSHVITAHYRNSLRAGNSPHNWDWNYFLLGTAVFAPVFFSVADGRRTASSGDSGDSGSFSADADSSCGGDSCGGCGGD